jgi:hypothetical protein
VKRKPPVACAIEEAVIASLREGHREFLRFVSRRTQNLDDASSAGNRIRAGRGHHTHDYRADVE